MANKYRSVLASGGGVQPTGNATVGDVLAGKTFSNADGIDKTGTMVNNGAVSETLDAGESYTIPAGYHNGSGVVSAAASVNMLPNYVFLGNTSGSSNNKIDILATKNGSVTVSGNGTVLNITNGTDIIYASTGGTLTFNAGDTITITDAGKSSNAGGAQMNLTWNFN